MADLVDADLERTIDVRTANQAHARYSTPAAWEEVKHLDGAQAWQLLIRPCGQRSSEAHSLFLTATENARQRIAPARQPEGPQQSGRTLRGHGAPHAQQTQRERDVLQCTQRRQQVERLEDEPDATQPNLGHVFGFVQGPNTFYLDRAARR